MDGSPCHAAGRHLGESQSSLLAGLEHGARPHGYAFPAPTTLAAEHGGEHTATLDKPFPFLLYGGGPIESARAGMTVIERANTASNKDRATLRMTHLPRFRVRRVCDELTTLSIQTAECLTGNNIADANTRANSPESGGRRP